MSIPATSYKFSPLSSQRGSPFRRPESPASPSPLRNSSTLASPPPVTQHAIFSSNDSPFESPTGTNSTNRTPRGLPPAPREPEKSPTKNSNIIANRNSMMGSTTAAIRGTTDLSSMSKLQPAQVRELREGFQILDRDSDGTVGRDDVAEMLSQLGLPSGPSDVAPFFPPSQPQTTTLPAFLTSISTLLSELSPSSELLNAFSAFDDDDSGQVDLGELKDALMHTAPEPGDAALTEREINKIMGGFSGRRAFSKGAMGKKGEVFKYHDFVAAVSGDSGNVNKENKEDEE